MENKLTAVEWLVEQITDGTMTARKVIQKAKAMEQDSIIQAYSNGWHDGQDVIINQVKHIDSGGDKAGKKYFNETYKTEQWRIK